MNFLKRNIKEEYSIEDETKNKHIGFVFKYFDDIKESEDVINALVKGTKLSFHYEKRYIQKSGNVIYADVNTALQKDKYGKPKFLITAISDITEAKLMQKILENFTTKIRCHPVTQRHIRTKSRLCRSLPGERYLLQGCRVLDRSGPSKSTRKFRFVVGPK